MPISGVRLDCAIYDDHIADGNFSADLGGAGWVNGSPAKPVEVGLGSAGGDTRYRRLRQLDPMLTCIANKRRRLLLASD
jgi:hypothetical protein